MDWLCWNGDEVMDWRWFLSFRDVAVRKIVGAVLGREVVDVVVLVVVWLCYIYVHSLSQCL